MDTMTEVTPSMVRQIASTIEPLSTEHAGAATVLRHFASQYEMLQHKLNGGTLKAAAAESPGENVTPLRRACVVDQRVVQLTERLHTLASSGELQALSYIGSMTDNRAIDGHVGYIQDKFAIAGMWLSRAVAHSTA